MTVLNRLFEPLQLFAHSLFVGSLFVATCFSRLILAYCVVLLSYNCFVVLCT